MEKHAKVQYLMEKAHKCKNAGLKRRRKTTRQTRDRAQLANKILLFIYENDNHFMIMMRRLSLFHYRRIIIRRSREKR